MSKWYNFAGLKKRDNNKRKVSLLASATVNENPNIAMKPTVIVVGVVGEQGLLDKIQMMLTDSYLPTETSVNNRVAGMSVNIKGSKEVSGIIPSTTSNTIFKFMFADRSLQHTTVGASKVYKDADIFLIADHENLDQYKADAERFDNETDKYIQFDSRAHNDIGDIIQDLEKTLGLDCQKNQSISTK